ncbi:hypothetical protein SCOCK_260007 [Actinacidiphila cocklensis]|uniref:Uncharacterized protein n=1 Tax=Actinacidiphila cocklensis TaxID=887465 RepID=A0A9W4DQL9_9ACTN|nr:hypothetical protein SCOCK_260007 [Actinacidiphila cocklensis]
MGSGEGGTGDGGVGRGFGAGPGTGCGSGEGTGGPGTGSSGGGTGGNVSGYGLVITRSVGDRVLFAPSRTPPSRTHAAHALPRAPRALRGGESRPFLQLCPARRGPSRQPIHGGRSRLCPTTGNATTGNATTGSATTGNACRNLASCTWWSPPVTRTAPTVSSTPWSTASRPSIRPRG